MGKQRKMFSFNGILQNPKILIYALGVIDGKSEGQGGGGGRKREKSSKLILMEVT